MRISDWSSDVCSSDLAILSILAIGIPIRFIATSVGSLLVSGRNMRNKSYIMGVVAVINLGSNALLIPVYGLYGAAISTIFCELILLIIYYAYSRKYINLKIGRSEEHKSELQSLIRNSYAVFCLKKKQMNNYIKSL